MDGGRSEGLGWGLRCRVLRRREDVYYVAAFLTRVREGNDGDVERSGSELFEG